MTLLITEPFIHQCSATVCILDTHTHTLTVIVTYPAHLSSQVKFWAGGAPPPPAVIKRFKDEIGVSCETVYGLTEVYGPVTRHQPDGDWITQGLAPEEIRQRCTYQIGDATLEDCRVMDPQTMKEVPADGKTIGEVRTYYIRTYVLRYIHPITSTHMYL
jgi:acyl-CoA synthetase (AMP-forming)/AMP-acid ligase II